MGLNPVDARRAARAAATAVGAVLLTLSLHACGPDPAGDNGRDVETRADPRGDPSVVDTWADDPPALQPLVEHARTESELREVVPAYTSGRGAMLRSVAESGEAESRSRQTDWYRSWLDELADLDFDALSVEGQVDYILLRNRIDFELAMLERGQEVVGGGEGPVGREGLEAHLAREMIPYSPDELLAISEQEFAWMDEALLDAAQAMGYGDDWRAAQEVVKQAAVPPGGKPAVVRDLQYQSEAFIQERRLISMPPLLREAWRQGMRSAEQQIGGAFFGGGEQIAISYATYEQTHDRKLMSMRGNNPHFNRATVQHELIPGHGHQGFMTSRFNPHRQPFGGPFWGEGWALYFEFVLWQKGFPRGPEDEIGMLFWRMHRAARIHFIINYHLGRMTPEEGVDYLVERVGFERANAEAEVSWGTRAAPLYQAAYMLGALQFWALREELVETGRMTEREFHDGVMRGGRMPVEMVRLRLTGEGLTPDYTTQWRFYGDPLESRTE